MKSMCTDYCPQALKNESLFQASLDTLLALCLSCKHRLPHSFSGERGCALQKELCRMPFATARPGQVCSTAPWLLQQSSKTNHPANAETHSERPSFHASISRE